ncbi:methyltransferase [Megalodesulfovibrio paquesii]
MDKPKSDFAEIERLRAAGFTYQIVQRCCAVGLFDALAQTPRNAEELAQQHSWQPAPTQGLLELLAAADLLAFQDGRYTVAQVAREHLTLDAPFSQRKAMALQHRFDSHVLQHFETLLRGERPARSHTDEGWSSEDGMEGTLQFARLGALQDVTAFVAGLPEFPTMRLSCDIGGNHGEYSLALLERNPALRAELFDLPDVAAMAAARIARRGFSDRMEAIACDIRTTPLPTDRYDLVLASHVLYAFMPNLADLLQQIHAALRPGGWFVAHHLSLEGGLPQSSATVLEFTTRMAGYATHFIDPALLCLQLHEAGFSGMTIQPAGPHECGRIVAGRRA